MKRIIIFGSAGVLSQEYIQLYPNENYILVDKNYDKEIYMHNNYVYIKENIEKINDKSLLIKYCKENKVEIEGIVYFQGINLNNDFFSITDADWDKTFTFNVKSIVFTLKNLYPYLYEKCSIVAIASQNGIIAHENRMDYGSSKAAVIHLVKNLSLELANIPNKDIKINCISPGYIYSDKSKEFLESSKGRVLKKKIPYGKFVKPSDIAHAVDYLLSSKSDAIRGQNLIVDYGCTL